jgi:cytochrome c-type biogenesis protein CcmH
VSCFDFFTRSLPWGEKPVFSPSGEGQVRGLLQARKQTRCARTAAETAIAIGLLAASLLRGDAPRKPTLESIGDQVMCLCGCNATLNHCPHRDCATVAEVRPLILKEIGAGKDETTILQDLAIRYGVQILAAPPARGFTLMAWILPGAGLLAGLSVVLLIAWRWRKPRPGPPAIPSPPRDPKVMAAMEKEMKDAGLGVGS